jgi:hypothetical protein
VSKPSVNDEKSGCRHVRASLRRCSLSKSRARPVAARSSNHFDSWVWAISAARRNATSADSRRASCDYRSSANMISAFTR